MAVAHVDAHTDEALGLHGEADHRPKSLGEVAGWARPLVLVSDGLDRLTEVLYVVVTAAFAIVMLVGVFFRYVLNNSLSWSDELALVIFAWSTFLAIATGFLHRKHVNVNIFIERLPRSWAGPVTILREGFTGGYLVSLLVAGIVALEVASRAHTDALQWPMTIPYMAIPTATALMLIHWLRMNFADVQGNAAIKGGLAALIALAFFAFVYYPNGFGYGAYWPVAGPVRFLLIAGALLIPLAIGVPVSIALGLMAVVYVGAFGSVGFDTGALQIFFGIEVLTYLAIPLLILSGTLLHATGIAQYIVDFALALIGRIRGGLAAADVVASYMFGDISGSAVSDSAAIGSIMVPQMKQRGYRADFCAALQGAAGTLGLTAPLSITILLYATAMNVSVSRLALATIAPATLVAGSFLLVSYIHARRHKYPKEHVPFREVIPRTLRALPGLFALFIIVGGILGGVITPAEIGTVLLFYVLLLSFFLYRTANLRTLYQSFIRAGHVSGMTLFLVATSAFVGFVLARDLVSFLIADIVGQLSGGNRYLVLLFVSIVFIFLGMLLEPPPMIVAFMPSFVPLLQATGIDPIHWGVLFIINCGIGMLTPPVALTLFVGTAIAGVRLDQAARAAIPFMIIMALDIVIMALFPHIPLFLPHVVFGYPLPPSWP
jgi:tripartite ATP-independent transporter DctM subunit